MLDHFLLFFSQRQHQRFFLFFTRSTILRAFKSQDSLKRLGGTSVYLITFSRVPPYDPAATARFFGLSFSLEAKLRERARELGVKALYIRRPDSIVPFLASLLFTVLIPPCHPATTMNFFYFFSFFTPIQTQGELRTKAH